MAPFREINVAHDVRDLLEARASSGREAFQIIDALFAKIIALLKKRFDISYLDAELMFADVKIAFEDVLYAEMRDQLRLEDAVDAVRLCWGDE